MKEPFDIELGNISYAIFPEEDDTYVVFKEGIEYMKIQKDTEGQWLKLDPDTDLTIFDENEEANKIGEQILKYPPADEETPEP